MRKVVLLSSSSHSPPHPRRLLPDERSCSFLWRKHSSVRAAVVVALVVVAVLVLTQLTSEWRIMIDLSSMLVPTKNNEGGGVGKNPTGSTNNQTNTTTKATTDYPLARTLTGTWMGNTWVPPTPWWRLYSVEDMQVVYRDRTVLWIGDSTARRTGMVHFSILNQTLPTTITPTNNDSTTMSSWSPPLASSPVHISAQLLERDIDLYKYSRKCAKWQNHTYTSTTSPPSATGTDISNSSDSSNNSSVVPEKVSPSAYLNFCQPVPHGEVALMTAFCLTDLRDVLRVTLREQQLQEQWLKQLGEQQDGDGVDGGVDGEVLAPIPIPSHDIIVVAIGIWQDARPRSCRLPPNETITTLIHDSMHLLTKIIALDRRRRRDAANHNDKNDNNGMRVIWRTGGWKHGMEQEQHLATLEMNKAIMDFIDAAHHGNHGGDDDDDDDENNSISGRSARSMSYVNWGDAVAPRSFDDRIRGDIPVHYGLEPRQMLVQMVTNQLLHMDSSNDYSSVTMAAR
jgi:hypothetical protein